MKKFCTTAFLIWMLATSFVGVFAQENTTTIVAGLSFVEFIDVIDPEFFELTDEFIYVGISELEEYPTELSMYVEGEEIMLSLREVYEELGYGEYFVPANDLELRYPPLVTADVPESWVGEFEILILPSRTEDVLAWKIMNMTKYPKYRTAKGDLEYDIWGQIPIP